MSVKRKMISVVAIAILAQGCSTFNDPNGVVSIDTTKSKMVIMQADRRAIFTFPDRLAYACPEPSPDVRADVEAVIKSLVELSAKLPNDITATAKSELESTRKLVTASLLQRSQGLQVLRDMLFQACLANLRGDMDPKIYASFVTVTLPNLTTTLITSEMVTKANGEKAILGGDDLKSFLQFVIGNNFAR
jgi:hypothetical protein